MTEPRRPLIAQLQQMFTKSPVAATPKPALSQTPATPTVKPQPIRSVAALPESAKRDAQAIGADLRRAGVSMSQSVRPPLAQTGGGGAQRAVQPVAPNQLTLERQVAARNSIAPTAQNSLTPAQPQKPVAVAKSDLGSIKPTVTPRPSLTNQQMVIANKPPQQGRSR